jgi:hypothetical protein
MRGLAVAAMLCWRSECAGASAVDGDAAAMELRGDVRGRGDRGAGGSLQSRTRPSMRPTKPARRRRRGAMAGLALVEEPPPAAHVVIDGGPPGRAPEDHALDALDHAPGGLPVLERRRKATVDGAVAPH